MTIKWEIKIDKIWQKSILEGTIEDVTIKIYPIRGQLIHVSVLGKEPHLFMSANFHSVIECMNFAKKDLF